VGLWYFKEGVVVTLVTTTPSKISRLI